MRSSASDPLFHLRESCKKPGIVKTPVLSNSPAAFCPMDFAQCMVLSGSLREMEIMAGELYSWS